MRVFVINASPKGSKSNTYKLTKAFLAGMREGVELREERFEVEEIQVSLQNIQPCLGCFSCWAKTPGRCCIQDDMGEVIQKRLWADVTIFSFPLYYFTVPGGLKNLIDRQLPMVLPFMVENETQTGNGSHPSRYDMSGKKIVVISTCGFYTAEGNYDGVHSLFDHMCGKDSYTTIFCGQGELFRVPELSKRTDEYLGYVKKAGKEYIAGEILLETRSELKQLLYPKETFENWADLSWGIEREKEKKESDALIFTKQMAGLYQKKSYSGKEQVLEMYYTDIDESYQIVLGKEGSQVMVDGSRIATTRIETPFSIWRSIAAGEIPGDEALMKHLYKVKGDFNLMLKWDDYFGGGNSGGRYKQVGADTREIHIPYKETNINTMLIPWISFWICAAMNSYIGSLVGIGACVLVPLFYYHHKKTLFDILSGALVGGFSIGMLIGMPYRIVMPLSYLSFGAMWTVTYFGKIPLTAHYSMNDYKGEDALENPLFIKTNRILTLIWGILYLLTSFWTYILMGTKMQSYIRVVNTILPFFMGIFTGWFQRWYPKKIARGEK